MQQEQTLKQTLVETLVKYKATKYPQTVDGKLVDCRLVILEPRLEYFVKQMHKKTKGAVNFVDFYNDCVFVIIEAVMSKFQAYHGWEVLINRSNKKAFNQLVKFLKNYIKKQALEGYIKEHGYVTSENVKLKNGEVKKRNVYVTTNFSSIDVTMKDKNEEGEVTLSETLEHSFWDVVNDDTKANNFLNWFRNNRNRILTNSQREFLDTLERCGYSENNKNTKEMQKSGINPKSTSTKLKAIEKRILKAWEKEQKFINQSFVEKVISRKISLLQIYLDIYDDHTERNVKQIQLSNFIRAHVDANAIENVFDKLSLNEYKIVAKAVQAKSVIPKDILDKLYVYAEQAIENLQITLFNERLMKQELAKKEGVVLPKEQKKIYTSSLYLHLDAFGSLHNKTKNKLGA